MPKIKLALFFKIVGIYWTAVFSVPLVLSILMFVIHVLTFGAVFRIEFKTVFVWILLFLPSVFFLMTMNYLISSSRHCDQCGAELDRVKNPIKFSLKTGKPTLYNIQFSCKKNEKEHPRDAIEMEPALLWIDIE
ncbi:MAG: hypothetical protein R2941_07910 [Desulfobacterales bacterium]